MLMMHWCCCCADVLILLNQDQVLLVDLSIAICSSLFEGSPNWGIYWIDFRPQKTKRNWPTRLFTWNILFINCKESYPSLRWPFFCKDNGIPQITNDLNKRFFWRLIQDELSRATVERTNSADVLVNIRAALTKVFHTIGKDKNINTGDQTLICVQARENTTAAADASRQADL